MSGPSDDERKDKAHAASQAAVLVCGTCGKRFTVAPYDPARWYVCKACQGTLELPPAAAGASAVAPTLMMPQPALSGPRSPDGGGPPPRSAPSEVPAPRPPDAPAPALPAASFGKYAIVRELGRGGMGVVYEAMDVELKRRVALKRMLAGRPTDPREAQQEEERFLREARLSANLPRHPHIVSVHDAGTIAGQFYIAMEFIPGLPMSEWRNVGPKTIRQQVLLLRDVALAVHHAHEHGIIHRDIKPPNVLVDGKDEPHVTDFGLAKQREQGASLSLTGAGMLVGTPAYVSPEQAQGLKTVDRRTDIWSLGVMLYETLTNRQPFEGESALDIATKVIRDPVVRPSSVVRERGGPPPDEALEGICLKALAKTPDRRYATAAAFAANLSAWLHGGDVALAVPEPATAPNRDGPPKAAAGGRHDPIEEQKAAPLDPGKSRLEDALLGRLLLRQGRVTAEQLNLCLRAQAAAIEEGTQAVPRLGALLVEKGFATPAAVSEALALQEKVILECELCRKRYNVKWYDPTKWYPCRACQGLLILPAEVDGVRVSEGADPPSSRDPAKPAAGPGEKPGGFGRGLMAKMGAFVSTLAPGGKFRTARSIHPDAVRACMKGMAHYERRQFSAALACFEEAVQVSSHCAEAYYGRGLVRRDRGDIPGSIEDFDKAVELDPRHARACQDRGVARHRRKDYDGAMMDFRRALELDPFLSEAYVGRGLAHFELGHYDAAAEDYATALSIDPENEEGYNNRGTLRQRLGDYPGALADFEKALVVAPPDWFLRRQVEKRVAIAQQAIRQNAAQEKRQRTNDPPKQPDADTTGLEFQE